MNLARSLQKVDEILNNLGSNEMRRFQIITLRHKRRYFHSFFPSPLRKKRENKEISENDSFLLSAYVVDTKHMCLWQNYPPVLTPPPKWRKILYLANLSGFGALEVACWPLAPKFVGSHPAEA